MSKDTIYIALVEKYRKSRREGGDQKRDDMILETVKKLRDSGKVSEEAIEATRYL